MPDKLTFVDPQFSFFASLFNIRPTQEVSDSNALHRQITRNLFFETQISSMSPTVLQAGGRRIRAEPRLDGRKPWMYVKATSRFSSFPVGSLDITETDDFLHIGCFNPIEIMNAQYIHNDAAVTPFVEDRSSHFLNMGDSASAPNPRQWDTPPQLSALKTIYKEYQVEFCKMMVMFRNTGTEDIDVYWKLFWPKDVRVRNFLNVDDFQWTTDANSLLALQGDASETSGGESRVSIARLESVNGMQKISLGPNTSNGLANIGTAYLEVNVKDMLNRTDPPDVFNATGFTAHATSTLWEHQNMGQTGHPHVSHQVPSVHFWAIQKNTSNTSTTPGVMTAVAADTDTTLAHPLTAEGYAEYTVRVSQLIGGTAFQSLDSDIT